MTIKMRLDTAGLRALIEDNPELQLEIEKKVMDNIQSDNIKAKVEAQVKLCIDSLVRNDGSNWKPRWVPSTPNFIASVRTIAEAMINSEVLLILNEKVEIAVYSAVESEKQKFQAQLKETLASMITPEMAKDIMKEKLFL